ncbi:MAG: hypothetical protein WDW38_008242 [Sanguina aurantia]
MSSPSDEPMSAESGRSDGRGAEEFRNVFIKTKVLSQAKGSAYVEFNNTKVMVGVFGPRQSERKHGFRSTGMLECQLRLSSFAAKQLAPTAQQQQQVSLEKELAASILQALTASVQLEKFPKAVFDVSVMVLEAGGADLAVAITAASVALADAGLELFRPGTRVSSGVSFIKSALDRMPLQVRMPGSQNGCAGSSSEPYLLLDPTIQESRRAEASCMLSMMVGLNQVTHTDTSGVWSRAGLQEALELGMGGCGMLKVEMREALLEAAVSS